MGCLGTLLQRTGREAKAFRRVKHQPHATPNKGADIEPTVPEKPAATKFVEAPDNVK